MMMNEESQKFFDTIKDRAKQDEYLWNLAQENPCVYITPEQEETIMERMFLVYYTNELQAASRYIEENEVIHVKNKRDIPTVIEYKGRRYILDHADHRK
jgi:hypothetical protein